jgi:hypothetical protein
MRENGHGSAMQISASIALSSQRQRASSTFACQAIR